jgi:hypothetical protein
VAVRASAACFARRWRKSGSVIDPVIAGMLHLSVHGLPFSDALFSPRLGLLQLFSAG